jgi:G:T/U-mismatch repair DNA glycosylase
MKIRTLCLVVLLGILCTATGYVLTRHTTIPLSSAAQNGAVPVRLSRDKIKRHLLPNQLRWALNELGDRVQQPGKERLTLAAELQRNSSSTPVQLILEFPDRLRLLIQDGPSARTITFDGNEAKTQDLPLAIGERDMIESLVYDGAEHFFISQTRGLPIRALGSRFRSEDGRYFDIYELTDSVNAGTARRVQSKSYCFNSTTLLLEKVRYTVERDGGTIAVETRLGDWQTSERQRFPMRITRVENGNPAWTLVISSVVISPMSDDGLFSTP